jgi:K+-transporting ATPase ATPase C chain
MLTEIKRGILFTIIAMTIFGGAYHAALWGIGRVMFPAQSEGSLIRRADGTVIGSRLIAQRFARDEYFHPRPSAVDYNAASTGGSNYGPSNPEYLESVGQRVSAMASLEGVRPDQIPAEMVTASGGGLDPDISVSAAELQAPRVARSRGGSREQVGELIRSHTMAPALGFLGPPRVNVLELNLALDKEGR